MAHLGFIVSDNLGQFTYIGLQVAKKDPDVSAKVVTDDETWVSHFEPLLEWEKLFFIVSKMYRSVGGVITHGFSSSNAFVSFLVPGAHFF